MIHDYQQRDRSLLHYARPGIVVVAIAITAAGGVKLGYALLADRALRKLTTRASRSISLAAGTVMIGVGIAVLFKGSACTNARAKIQFQPEL